MHALDRIGQQFTITQLSCTLLGLCSCIIFVALLQHQPAFTVADFAALDIQPNDFLLQPCPHKPEDYDENWSWCHGGRYKVCKANFPIDSKQADLLMLLGKVGR
jgi:hypothetical protein